MCPPAGTLWGQLSECWAANYDPWSEWVLQANVEDFLGLVCVPLPGSGAVKVPRLWLGLACRLRICLPAGRLARVPHSRALRPAHLIGDI